MKQLNFRSARIIVTAMTLFATSLTASVCSADDAPTAATAAPIASAIAAPTAQPIPIAPIAPTATAAEPATPLQLRETHPLALAQDPGASSGWKLVAALAVMAAGAYAFKKHSEKNKPAETIKSLQVLKKLSIGVRTELIVVDVDGQRLLLGVTPNAIQTLASLPDPDPEPVFAEIEQEPLAQAPSRFTPTYRPGEIGERSQQLGERLAALVNRSRIPESEKPAAADRPDLRVTARPQRRATTKKSVAPEAMEGQVRGVTKIGRI